jgi:hypothetical protein
MKTEYLIEKFKVEEFDLLVPLMQDCFGMSVDIGYFKWKFIENPAGELIAFVAKDDDGNIVSFEGLIPELYNINGKQQRIYQSVDSMTHSEHRRKGLFKKLSFACYGYITDTLHEKILVTGFGGDESTPVLFKLGWKYVFTVYFHFKSNLQIKLFGWLNNNPAKFQDYKIKDISNIEEIIPLINNNSDKRNIEIQKNNDFIKWRISNPRFKYIIKGVFDNNDDLKASAIFYIDNNKIMLFDASVDKEDLYAEKMLFNWLDNQVLKNRYKGIITFSQENNNYSKLLKKHGFLINKTGYGPMKFKLPFMYFAQKENIDKFKDEKLWSITPFDHDAF